MLSAHEVAEASIPRAFPPRLVRPPLPSPSALALCSSTPLSCLSAAPTLPWRWPFVTAVVDHVLLRCGELPMPLAVCRIWDNMWHTTQNHHCAAGSACAGDGGPAAVHSEQGPGPVRALPRALPQGALMKRYFGSFVHPALHRLSEPSKLIRSTCRPFGIAMPRYHAPVLATS